MKRLFCGLSAFLILLFCGGIAYGQTEPTAEKERTLTLAAVGDVLIHGAVYTDAARRAATDGMQYDFRGMFEEVAPFISAADVAFVNQESPVAGGDVSGYPRFSSPREIGDALVDVGFDVINLANNHMLDRGSAGFHHSLDYWKTKDVLTVGGYESAEDRARIRMIEHNGIRLAFLSYTEETNGLYADEEIPYFDRETAKREIRAAREIADFVVVSLHWGCENALSPSCTQEADARFLADAGADVILGHHSHTLEKIERLSCKNGRECVVAYSLGNFLSAMLQAKNLVGGILTVTLSLDESGGHVNDVSFLPTVCHYDRSVNGKLSGRSNVSVIPLARYTAIEAAAHGANEYGEISLPILCGFADRAVTVQRGNMTSDCEPDSR